MFFKDRSHDGWKRGREMIITDDGYSIEQYPQKNQIIISLPQTDGSLTNTIGTVSTRKTRLTANELTMIVNLVRLLMVGKDEDG